MSARVIRFTLYVILMLVPAFRAGAASMDPLQSSVTFHLGFENGGIADKALGGGTPADIFVEGPGAAQQHLTNQQLTAQYITGGLQGSGLTNASFSQKLWLAYPVDGNINYKKGTV